MTEYSLKDAQNQLKRLILDAKAGKIVLILDEDQNAVQLIPVQPFPKPRQAGSARGQIKIAPDFDAPLDDFSEYIE
jgi:antitoxin (DNA-binding transcriptional repressor) of toxin-antitoxin stability system